MDTLSEVLNRFQLQANVFFSGNLCEISEFNESLGPKGHLHILRGGSLELIDGKGDKFSINKPSILFFPQGRFHRMLPNSETGADLVCATIDYTSPQANPISRALPSMLSIDISKGKNKNLAQTANWIFEEAFEQKDGKEVMINKLCDIFIIQILRSIIDSASVKQGMLAGLAHPYLNRALIAIHKNPQLPWRIESLAQEALMSRSKFAYLFKSTVGQTPLDYLTEWRIQIAQSLLSKNKSVEMVATQVGYENGSALARVFKKKLGMSPKLFK
ncbi:AraC family transcriptional regulator [Glaciecola sp. SC05]|uniref:AraC family transcriptional regulator n=1 Tax=Glaciecola sp. SC05 TaxID=1987355 RepID=UPI003528EBC3